MTELALLLLLALAGAGGGPSTGTGAPDERPPDELIDLLRDADLLDGYGDLLEVETDDDPAEPSSPPRVQEGQDGRP